MESISSLQNDNIGGVVNLFYMPVDEATGETVISDHQVTSIIQRAPNEAWYKADVTRGTKRYKEEHKQGDNGDVWVQKVECFVPGDSRDLIRLFNEMKRQRFLVCCEDIEGNDFIRLFGTKSKGMRFTYKFDSKGSFTGRKGYQLTWELTSPNPAPRYPYDPTTSGGGGGS